MAPRFTKRERRWQPETAQLRTLRAQLTGLLSLTAILAIAACGGSSGPAGPTPPPSTPTPPTIPAGLSPTLTAMLQDLSTYISAALAENQELLPRNPQSSLQLQAKIVMLQNPALAADIINNRRWGEGGVTSMNGQMIPIVSVFPLETMRSEATQAVRTLEPVLSLLEVFFDASFPTPSVRVWYGFKVGNSGGGGAIYAEDRTTYEGRTGPTRLPYDAILGHELGHSYIGNETLTQFLELYTYNVLRTGSRDPSVWVFVRDWTPGLPANKDVAAVLDVYQLIGHDLMARAFRAIQPLRPGYGSPLSPAVIQAFLAQVPLAQQPQVAEKLARIAF